VVVEVPKEVEVERIVEVEVEKVVEVEIEKIVEVEIEKIVEVEVEKVLIATPTPPPAKGAPRYGGTLRVVSQGSIATLDPVFSQFGVTNAVASQFYDRTFGWGRDLNPVPQMIDTWDLSADGLTWTLTLRDGLRFHDLDPVTAADVAQSFERWLPSTFPYAVMMVNFAADPWTNVIDDSTFQLKMSEPYGAVLDSIAPPHKVPIIMKERLAQTPYTEAVTEHIGSAPYKFALWNPGDRIILERFEEYVPRTDPPNGFGGRLNAYIDRIIWLEIPDEETKIAGLESGEWDVVDNAGLDFFQRLNSNPDLTVSQLKPGLRSNIMLNPWQYPFGNDAADAPEGELFTDNAKLMRRAVAVGTDIEATMQGIGPRDLWILCDRIYYCGTPFGNDTDVRAGGSKSGDEHGLYYNENDKDKARQMALDAGYAGETLTLLNPNDYSTITPVGIVMKQEMEEMGFVVESPNRDWATVVTIFTTQENWHANSSWSGHAVTTDPINNEEAAGGAAFWPTIPEMLDLRVAWAKELDPAKRRAIRMDVEELHYTQVTVVFLGTFFGITPHTAELVNFPPNPKVYANAWLER
jgi:peptide/nickel transport system substrate-binding protein